MRTITKQIAAAFNAQKPLKKGNTVTDGNAVWLHGNKIVERREDGIYATLARWNTPTTRERVKGICDVSCYTCKGQAFIAGKPVNNAEWVKIA